MEFILKEYNKNTTKEELIEDVKKVYRLSNALSFSYALYRINGGKYSDKIVYTLFNGWIDVLNASGIKPSDRQLWLSKSQYKEPIKTEDLIKDFQRVANLLNKERITGTEYNKYGQYCAQTFSDRFGGWNNTLIKCGLKPYEVFSGKRISEKELLLEIEKMWTTLGKQPTTKDIKKGYSKYSLHAYQRRFGSWMNALKFFVTYKNLEKEKKSVNLDELLNVYSKNKKEKNRPLPLKTRFKVLGRDRFKCCKCGRFPTDDNKIILEVDHIIPISKGGTNELDNLQTLCNECNLGKGNK